MKILKPLNTNIPTLCKRFPGGLQLAPESSALVTLDIENGSWSPEGLELAYDNGNWYGFIMNFRGKNLIRIDFGNSLSNPPIYTNLGIIGNANLYEQPRKVRIVRDLNGEWFGFINNDNNPPQTPTGIVKLNFGNSLTNTPTASTLVSGSDWYRVRPMEFVYDNGELKMITLNYPDNTTPPNTFSDRTVSVFNFGNSYNNTPVITRNNILPAFTSFTMRITKQGNNWYAITFGLGEGANGQGVRVISFGNNLNNTPTIVREYSNFSNFGTTFESSLVKDGKNTIAFVLNGNGDIFRFNFGEDILTAPSFTNLGNFGLLGTQQLANRPSLCMAMAKDNSQWHLFAINRHPHDSSIVINDNQNQLVRLIFRRESNGVTLLDSPSPIINKQ